MPFIFKFIITSHVLLRFPQIVGVKHSSVLIQTIMRPAEQFSFFNQRIQGPTESLSAKSPEAKVEDINVKRLTGKGADLQDVLPNHMAQSGS